MAGGPNIGKIVVNWYLHKPVHLYVGGAGLLTAVRYYQTQSTFNYWFGKIEFDRRMERNQL